MSGTVEEDEEIPAQIADYIEHHQLEPTVNRIVNRVLKERPADPLLTIAQSLMNQSTGTKSYPTFDKLQARRVFINDNTAT